MKVIFDYLNKIELISSAYEFERQLITSEYKTDIPEFSKRELKYCYSTDEIDYINGIYLGLKFKGNYVEFEDNKKDLYLNLIYAIKINDEDYQEKMKSDFILEHEYKHYVEEINRFGDFFTENKKAINLGTSYANLLKDQMTEHPELLYDIVEDYCKLLEVNKQLESNLKKIKEYRESLIIQLFNLEGTPNEFGTR